MCVGKVGRVFCEAVSTFSIHLDTLLFYPLLWRTVHLVFRSVSEGNDPYVAVIWYVDVQDFALPLYWIPPHTHTMSTYYL